MNIEWGLIFILIMILALPLGLLLDHLFIRENQGSEILKHLESIAEN